MSINITGGALKENVKGIVLGKKGKLDRVSVNTTGYINRNTTSTRIKKYLKEGWNWNKFTPIVVAKFPNGNLKLLDGDHRRHMYKHTFPNETMIDGWIIEVSSKEEYHELFHEINWSARANASKEEVFVHKVKAANPEALKIVAALDCCGLVVFGSEDVGGTVGSSVHGAPCISVTSFKKALTIFDNFTARGYTRPHNTKLAAVAIKSAWPSDTKINSELFGGVSLLYSLYPHLSDGNSIAKDWDSWIENVGKNYPQKASATDWKTLGGKVHHKELQSIALGMLKQFQNTSGQSSSTYKKSRLTLSDISFENKTQIN